MFSKMNLENCIDIKIGKTSDDYPCERMRFEKESNLNFYFIKKLRFKSKM